MRAEALFLFRSKRTRKTGSPPLAVALLLGPDPEKQRFSILHCGKAFLVFDGKIPFCHALPGSAAVLLQIHADRNGSKSAGSVFPRMRNIKTDLRMPRQVRFSVRIPFDRYLFSIQPILFLHSHPEQLPSALREFPFQLFFFVLRLCNFFQINYRLLHPASPSS